MPLTMSNTKASTLKEAVDGTPDVGGNHKNGLSALRGSDRGLIVVPDTRKISGSLDIDGATERLYPKESRWDYAVEYDGEVFFIEVHPASTTEIKALIKNYDWLKNWLKTKAPRIDALKAKSKHPYHWVHTGSSKILKSSRHYKELTKRKLLPVKVWDYSKL